MLAAQALISSTTAPPSISSGRWKGQWNFYAKDLLYRLDHERESSIKSDGGKGVYPPPTLSIESPGGASDPPAVPAALTSPHPLTGNQSSKLPPSSTSPSSCCCLAPRLSSGSFCRLLSPLQLLLLLLLPLTARVTARANIPVRLGEPPVHISAHAAPIAPVFL